MLTHRRPGFSDRKEVKVRDKKKTDQRWFGRRSFGTRFFLGDNSHGELGLITLSDKKDWEASGQNALLVISLNVGLATREASKEVAEKYFPITELERKLNVDIKANFDGDPPWAWFNISIPSKGTFLNFNIRISNLDDVSYGGKNTYMHLASQILSTFKFTK